MTELLTNLNDSQRQAVLYEKGDLLLLAGPGTGKTLTLTHRIAYLILECGVPFWKILPLTFSDNIAAIINNRLKSLLEFDELPWAATYHVTCARILRQNIAALGYSRDFTIYDDQDKLRLLKKMMKEKNLSETISTPDDVASYIESAKNRGFLPEELPEFNSNGSQLAELYFSYQRRLEALNAVDLEDLVLLTVRLLERHPDVHRRWQHRFDQILIDDLQDMNIVQLRLVKLLLNNRTNLFMAGDDDQSIYRWRFADLGNILKFNNEYFDAKVFRLEKDYRSAQIINKAAQRVIENNTFREPKKTTSINITGELLQIKTATDDFDEASFVANEISQLQCSGVELRDVAVLFRTNKQSRILEEALWIKRLPYVTLGCTKLYSRPEVKIVLAYLRILLNPEDSISALRVINVPSRGISKATVEEILTFECEAGGFLPACRLALDNQTLKESATKKVASFLRFIDDFNVKMARLPYPQLVAELIQHCGYELALQKESTNELNSDDRPAAKGRSKNLEQFLVRMEEFATAEESLADCLERVALITNPAQHGSGLVSLMTLHAAKGLEFPVVFMTGMEEGLLPHFYSSSQWEDVDEERRLCYVGMTRAKQKLYLSHARRRRVYGTYNFNPSSRFLAEIPLELRADFEPEATETPTMGHNLSSLADLISAIETTSPVGDEVSPVPHEEPIQESIIPDADGMRVGIRVRHVKFGIGTVRRLEGSGDKQKVTVYFNSVGSKKLLLKFSTLIPID